MADSVLFGECVGFDGTDLALRLDTLPISLVIPRSNIAVILPLVPDWSLQADEEHAKLLAQVATQWGNRQPLHGPALEALQQQYAEYIKQQGEQQDD